jgi:hypothetical protein
MIKAIFDSETFGFVNFQMPILGTSVARAPGSGAGAEI